MSGAAIPWRLEIHDSLASTSDLARIRAEAGEGPGLAVLAHEQTGGRGTHGRSWASPRGNLHLSVLLRPPITAAEASGWSLRVGAIVAGVLQPHAPGQLAIKPPNDILLGGAKLAGILIETMASGTMIDWMVIGIGVNLAHAPALPDRPTAHLGGRLAPEPAARLVLAGLAEGLQPA